MDFTQTKFALFITSVAGRVVRVIAGIALIVIGLALVGGVWGWVVAAVGLVPLAAGVFDLCIFSPLFGGAISGGAIRACRREEKRSS